MFSISSSNVVKISYVKEDGKSVELSYNPLKQLTAMKDHLGVTSIELDALGRATKVTDHEGSQTGYSYNSFGQRDTLTYPDGNEARYKYDMYGRLEEVIYDPRHTRNSFKNFVELVPGTMKEITKYSYDSVGRLSGRTLHDQTETRYEYNSLGAITNLTHKRDGLLLDEFKYAYDSIGNITQIERYRKDIESESGIYDYTYDVVGRLHSVVKGDIVKRYRYDELGNRVGQWGGHKYDEQNWTQHTYNARNQLIKTQEGDLAKDYSYDKRGNLISVRENGKEKESYIFDPSGMMAQATLHGSTQTEYIYNGFKNRVGKIEMPHVSTLTPAASAGKLDPTREVRYLLDMTKPYDNLIATRTRKPDIFGEQEQNFIWGNSFISAVGDTDRAGVNKVTGKDTFFYLQDHLGSPIRLIGMEENIDILKDAPMAYDEFGVPKVTAVNNQYSFDNPFGFTGYTSETNGLQYAQARFYNPNVGRFTAQDTVRDGLNWYEYCRSNPLSFVDLDGRTAESFMNLCSYTGKTWESSSSSFSNPYTTGWTSAPEGTWDSVSHLNPKTVINNAMDNLFGNECQSTVLNARFISTYRGQVVLRPPGSGFWGGSYSRFMMLGGGVEYDDRGRNLLSHEHEHFNQYLEKGLVKYTFTIAIPSAWSFLSNYIFFIPTLPHYRQAWEVQTDVDAGIDRGHSKEDIAFAAKYFDRIRSLDGFVDWFRFLILEDWFVRSCGFSPMRDVDGECVC